MDEAAIGSSVLGTAIAWIGDEEAIFDRIIDNDQYTYCVYRKAGSSS
jgi:hypothetical protein